MTLFGIAKRIVDGYEHGAVLKDKSIESYLENIRLTMQFFADHIPAEEWDFIVYDLDGEGECDPTPIDLSANCQSLENHDTPLSRLHKSYCKDIRGL